MKNPMLSFVLFVLGYSLFRMLGSTLAYLHAAQIIHTPTTHLIMNGFFAVWAVVTFGLSLWGWQKRPADFYLRPIASLGCLGWLYEIF